MIKFWKNVGIISDERIMIYIPISSKTKSSGFLMRGRAAVGRDGRLVDCFFFGLFLDIRSPISISPVTIARLNRSKFALALLFFLA